MVLHVECARLQFLLLLVCRSGVRLVVEGFRLVYFFLYGLLEFAVEDDKDSVAWRSLGIDDLVLDVADLLPVVEQFVKGCP